MLRAAEKTEEGSNRGRQQGWSERRSHAGERAAGSMPPLASAAGVPFLHDEGDVATCSACWVVETVLALETSL